MGAANDANDAAFGAARARHAGEARDAGDDVIAVHGVFNVVARDEEIAVDIGDGDIGDDEAVTVLMEHEAAANFVARGGLMLGNIFGRARGRGRGGSGASGTCGPAIGLLTAAKKEAAVGKFFDETTLFEAKKHLQQGAAVVFFDVQAAGEFVEGDGVIPKLKKTQDVIGAQL
jgi:hypothetical protein